ncbi:MAG: hypothetical protein K2N38_00840 [Oscillospiraceae bacterium]|nr:hypothetical protein [Oscillospiraceae bacterium]
MKKLLRIVSILISSLLLSGCARLFKPYDSFSRTDDTDTFEPSAFSGRGSELLGSAFESARGNAVALVLDGEEMSVESADDFSAELAVSVMADMLSEEGYSAYGQSYSSREEFASSMLKGFEQASRFDTNGDLRKPQEALIHICIKLPKSERSKEMFLRAAEEITALVQNAGLPEDGKPHFANAEYSLNRDGLVTISVKFAGNDSMLPPLSSEIVPDGSGVMVCGVKLPSDTEKLVLSSRDRDMVDLLGRNFIPEDCEYICGSDSNFSDIVYDFAEIAKKLPKLKELYMYQAQLENADAVSELKHLEALSYYVTVDPYSSVTAAADFPFKDLPNLRSLWIYGNYDDYSFLNDMTGLEELYVSIDGDVPESLFDCPAVTSLKISKNTNILGNIDRLQNLRELEISSGSIDFAPISRLKKLEKLYVWCWDHALNLTELGKADSIKTLLLSDIKDHRDWSFLREMSGLSDLSVNYLKGIDGSDMAALKKLKSLSVNETFSDYEFLGEMTALEKYSEIMGRSGDYSSLSRCRNLKSLELLGCSGKFDCAYVQDLPLESLDCNGTNVDNPLLLCGIPTLKYLSIAIEGETFEYEDELCAALPDCEINLSDAPFFHAW